MVYVRVHGNQVSLVHGERDKDTGKVQQRSLFTFYSKKEAGAAIGDAKSGDAIYFQNLLTDANPQLKFDWPALRQELRRHLEILPADYPLRKAHGGQLFEHALFDFARQLVLADPVNSSVGRETLKSHAAELSTLQKIISLRQEELEMLADSAVPTFDTDDGFCWRYEIQSNMMPLGMEEFASELYRQGQYDEARSLFSLLIRCFPDYAEGYNYLGLMALNDDLPKEAVEFFKRTVKHGRNLFPRRMAKGNYWLDLKTRPYLRGLMNLALAHNMAGQFKDTLSVCETLIKECGVVGEEAAWAHRAIAHMNLLNWAEASAAAFKIADSAPDEGFVLGYSLFELERPQEALKWFLHASLNSPISAHLLLDKSRRKPKGYLEIEDHNAGVTLLRSLPRFFRLQSKASTKFFNKFIENESVKALLSEVMNCAQRHSAGDDSKRENFACWHKLKSLEFATETAELLAIDLGIATSSSRRIKR